MKKKTYLTGYLTRCDDESKRTGQGQAHAGTGLGGGGQVPARASTASMEVRKAKPHLPADLCKSDFPNDLPIPF